MMSEKELLRIEKHVAERHNESAKMRRSGQLDVDSGPPYFEHIRNLGWLQAIRAILGKSNAELVEDSIIEEKSWEK